MHRHSLSLSLIHRRSQVLWISSQSFPVPVTAAVTSVTLHCTMNNRPAAILLLLCHGEQIHHFPDWRHITDITVIKCGSSCLLFMFEARSVIDYCRLCSEEALSCCSISMSLYIITATVVAHLVTAIRLASRSENWPALYVILQWNAVENSSELISRDQQANLTDEHMDLETSYYKTGSWTGKRCLNE